MKLVYAVFSLLLLSCHSNNEHEATTAPIIKNDSISNPDKKPSTDSVDIGGDNNGDYSVFFIVIADTGKDYFSLQQKMFGLHKMTGQTIDTMGRYYNKRKDLISLPENDKDELYAGNYFPRRFSSESLSLEYLKYYQENAGDKTIALVAGIYETEKSADSSLQNIGKNQSSGFYIKSRIYTGCIH